MIASLYQQVKSWSPAFESWCEFPAFRPLREPLRGAKCSCDQTQGGKRGAKGHINPCQRRPNYLSPCANKWHAGQPVGGGRGKGWWCVRSVQGLAATLQPDPHHSSSYLSLLSPLLITLRHTQQAPATCTARTWRLKRSCMSSFQTWGEIDL